MARAIWEDYKIVFENVGDIVPYTIKVDGEVVYKGRAYALIGEGAPYIYLNRIVQDYLSSKVDGLVSDGDVKAQPHYLRVASVEYGDKAVAESFINDYSYDYRVRSEGVQLLSKPMSNVVDCRQLLVTTFANFGGAQPVELVDGVGTSLAEVSEGRCNTFVYNLNGGYEGESISLVANQGYDILATYDVRRTCATHALYYLNAYGGYDHMLIRGNVVRSEDYARTEITRDIANTTYKHGRQYIANDVQTKWRLHTDYLTDEQWLLTHHLLGSTDVYLHNLETGELTPIVITSNSAEFKTYRNQGRKKSYLTIECEASVKKMRK